MNTFVLKGDDISSDDPKFLPTMTALERLIGENLADNEVVKVVIDPVKSPNLTEFLRSRFQTVQLIADDLCPQTSL